MWEERAHRARRDIAALAASGHRKESVAKLSDLPDRERDRSARFNNVWRPLGLDRELRVLFLVDGAC